MKRRKRKRKRKVAGEKDGKGERQDVVRRYDGI